MSDRLKQNLDVYNAFTLQDIARATSLLVPGGPRKKKASLLSLLATKLGTAERVQYSLAKLDDGAKAVLTRLQRLGGRTPTSRFKRQLIKADLVEDESAAQGAFRSYSYRKSQSDGNPHDVESAQFADVIARLTLHGFVFTEQTIGGYGYNHKMQFDTGDILFIPPEIKEHLPEPESKINSNKGWQPEKVVQGDPALYLRDLYLYWGFVCRQPVGLTQQGYVRKNALKTINRTLLQPDSDLPSRKNESESQRLYLMRQQLEHLDMIFLSGAELVADAALVPPFWMAGQDTQLAMLLAAWIETEGGRISYQSLDYSADWQSARTSLIKHLAPLNSGEWVECDPILDQLIMSNESFFFPDKEHFMNEHIRYYGRYGSKNLPGQIEDADHRFLIQAAVFPLAQLGLVTVGYANETDAEWAALSLTEQGKRVLTRLSTTLAEGNAIRNLGEHSEPDPGSDGGQVIVQPNFHVLAMGPVSMATLARLDACAERQKADITVFEFQLTRESVYYAQQHGMVASEIMDFLTEASGMSLPQNVRRSLEEWGARHQRITFRTGVTLLQTVDEDHLSALLNSPDLKADLQPSPVSNIAYVEPAHQRRVANRLLGQGILPAHDDGKPASANGGVHFHDDGRVEPIHALSSLQLTGRLNRFADAIDDADDNSRGGWRITLASVQRAGGNRAKVDEIVADMTRLQRGDLPAELVKQVKRWGGYYGSASVDTLTLIEFTDAKTLRELLKDRRLRSLLTPFKAGDRALATIAVDDLPEIEELLLERGIAVQRGIVAA